MNKLKLLILLWEELLRKIKEKKQIDALADLKPKEIKPIKTIPRETKPREYSDYFLNGCAIIQRSFEPVNFYGLTYSSKDSSILPVNFIEFKGPNVIFKITHDGDIPLEDVENEQIKLKSELGYIKQGNPRNRSVEQEKTINKIENLYNSREEIVEMFNNYARNISRNIYDAKQEGTGLKILTL